ncbi:MAG TPA: glutamate racemase [Trueperaceae bacterium]
MLDLRDSPLGVFDSGVGGLTVLRELQRSLPHEDFLYLGDTARVPYGSKPAEMVREFAREISWALIDRDVKGIVIACNTASATSLPELADHLPVPVWGVIEPGVRAAAASGGTGRIGILGTVSTIRSRAYQSRLEALGLETWARACPLFVPIVEEGVSDTEIAELVARHYLGDRPPLGAVILGCTHYPVLKGTLQTVLGARVELVDSAESTAATVAGDLEKMGLTSPREREGRIHHLVTGDLDSYLHTARVLGGPEGTAERLALPLGPRDAALSSTIG